MMDIDEMKERVATNCEDWSQMVPYDSLSVEAETWDELADYLSTLASVVARGANSIAAYAGIARRKANSQ